jgi:hypothetical protein
MTTHQHIISKLVFVVGVGLAIASGCARKSSTLTLEKQFRELPMDSRRLTGPLFWLHGEESKEHLEMYVGKVAEGGNGSFTAESRPHKDWLGEGWYRDLGILLDAAKKNDLKLWIFDEKWWPSGEVGGQVPPKFGAKTMLASAQTLTGPTQHTGEGFAEEFFIAAVAGREIDGAVDGNSLLDLRKHIKDGKLTWNVPAGQWKVMKFTWKYTGGQRILVDGASQASVDWYIKTVYQPHYDRFKNDFGKTIVGYFYDEPETPGDWGTEVPKLLAERGIDWKKAYVAWKFKLADEEQTAAKYQYQDAFAEAWGRTLYGGITRWCREHRVQSIGHWLEHHNEYLNPRLCAGNMFQVQKYSDMGGIDAVFKQFAIGKRVANDPPCWQTPKLGSSITHAYGKPDDVTMVEIFGARGQDLTYPEMKWWLDHMQVSGVNFIIPHSFNPKSPYDTDCPPYFYNNGFEPRWPLYRVFADYSSRLTLMLTGGRHVCPVALLYLGNSKHVGEAVTPEYISEALQDALYDCDWLPYEVFENDTKLSGGQIRLRDERYRVLIVPPVEAIPYATMAKIKRFYDQGGIVVGHGFLPSKSTTLGKSSDELAALRDAVWGVAPPPGSSVCRVNQAGGRSYLLPQKPTPRELEQVLSDDAQVRRTLEVVQGRTDNWLHVLHRVKEQRDVFFICNQNHEGAARPFRFRIAAAGVPECWDAMRNQITAVSYTRDGDSVLVDLTLEPLEAVLLVFQPEQRQLPVRPQPNATPPRSLALERLPSPPVVTPELKNDPSIQSLSGCSWVWFPEGNAAAGVPPGARYFRKTISLPADRKIRSARFVLSADNEFVLYVNGKDAGRGSSWANPSSLDIAALLKPGPNVLAVAATNGGANRNPAGLIGKLAVAFEQGESMQLAVDATWKTANTLITGWNTQPFDDSAWTDAAVAVPFGEGPWGSMTGGVTLSPVKADPYLGRCVLPAGVDLARSRVCLEFDAVAPEAAASIRVNGQYAGGVIGKPFRLDVTRHLKQGINTFEIVPFAPESVRLVIQSVN